MENITSFEWSAASAEAVLLCGAVLAVLFEALFPKRRAAVCAFAVAAMIAAMALDLFAPVPDLSFGGMLGGRGGFGVFITACALLSALLGFGYFSKGGARRCEFLAVLMICAAALSVFARSRNLTLSFVALECATVCLYVMAAWSRSRASSLEGAAKYLVTSGVSGGLFLLGIAFVYGAGLESGVDFLNFENFTLGFCSGKFVAGMLLVASAALFKLAAFPFQFWSPDVYQGSPTPVSAFFAVGSKAAGIVFLSQMCLAVDFSAIPEAASRAVMAVSAIAALTIAVGNLGAITQTNAKRLMGFSGIANAGYLLVLLASLIKYPKSAELFEISLYFYLAAYMFANYGIFFVINQFEGEDDSALEFSDFRGLIRKNPVADSALIISLASLAGIPPTAGFFGKLLILILAWYAQLYVLMGVMIAGSAVSIFYYFSWMRASVDAGEGGERRLRDSAAMLPTMIALSAATLVFGVFFFFRV